MNRLSAIDAFGPAFTRVSTMLFKPFRLSTWLKMGFIGFLGGGLVTSSLNTRGPAIPPQLSQDRFPNDPMGEINRALRSIHLADYINLHLIFTLIAVVLFIGIIFLYLFP